MDAAPVIYCLLFIAGVFAAYRHHAVKYYTKFFLFCFIISIGSFYYLVEFLFRGRSYKNSWRFKTVFWLTGRIIGLNPIVKNKELLTPDVPCIYVANHQSCIDVISLVDVWPERCTVISKTSLKYAGPVGVIGWFTKLIFIDRSKHREAVSAMKHAAAIAKENQISIYVFAEGTRSSGDKLLPFKKGAFHLAVECQPIVIARYSSFLNHDEKRFDDGTYYVQVLPQISTKGMDSSNVDDLLNEVHQKMQLCYDSL